MKSLVGLLIALSFASFAQAQLETPPEQVPEQIAEPATDPVQTEETAQTLNHDPFENQSQNQSQIQDQTQGPIQSSMQAPMEDPNQQSQDPAAELQADPEPPYVCAANGITADLIDMQAGQVVANFTFESDCQKAASEAPTGLICTVDGVRSKMITREGQLIEKFTFESDCQEKREVLLENELYTSLKN